MCNGTSAPLDHDNGTPSHEFTLWEEDITHNLYYLHVIQAAVGTAIIPVTFCEYLLLTSLCLCLSLYLCSSAQCYTLTERSQDTKKKIIKVAIKGYFNDFSK